MDLKRVFTYLGKLALLLLLLQLIDQILILILGKILLHRAKKKKQ